MFHYGKSGDTNFFARLSLTSPDALLFNPPLHLTPREESKAWQIEINERGEKRWCGDNAGAWLLLWFIWKNGGKTTERIGEKACEDRRRTRDEEGDWVTLRKRQIICPSIIINSPAAALSRPTVSSSAPLSPLWVMTGSNWWILLTFSSSSFLTRVDLHARVRAPRVPAQVMYITIFPLIRSGSGGALKTVLLCNVTNWAHPVRGEDIGNNGVQSDGAARVKTIPPQSALPRAR